MKRFFIGYLVAAMLMLLSGPGFTAETEQETQELPTEGYLIGPGDLLEITVWKNSDLSQRLPVLPDGGISLPLVGEVTASGKSVKQLTEELKSRFAMYITDPILSVSVQQVNSMLVYVIGQVKAPGMYTLNTNVDVLQALARSAGLTPFAEGDAIKIFRKTGGRTEILNFDYDDVSRGRNLEQNIILQRGDVIVVP